MTAALTLLAIAIGAALWWRGLRPWPETDAKPRISIVSIPASFRVPGFGCSIRMIDTMEPDERAMRYVEQIIRDDAEQYSYRFWQPTSSGFVLGGMASAQWVTL